MKRWTMLTVGALALLASTAAEAATELRILWYSDGNEGEVLQDLVKRFEADNPDIKVVIDNVSYSVVKDQLPVQLEAGRGPDIVRVTELKSLAGHWLDMRPHLKDAAYWEQNFGNTLDWMRPDGSDAIPGFMTQLTVTGPLVNLTLFEQAGVALPGAKATWDEWAAAARKVAENQKVPIALAMDRSGHRFTGPAISMGAKLIGADDMPAVVDDGFKAMAERIAKWHEDGTMPKEIWGGAAGTTYKGANEEFVNGQVAVYYSGSWQIGQFSQKIGDAFDWSAVPQPCGPAACTGMPGGAGMVAVRYTKSPEAVAKLMEFLASEAVVKEFSERTLFIPAHRGLAEKGIDFQSDDANAKRSLDTFLAMTKTLSPIAERMASYKWAGAIYAAVISRLGQVVAGEMTLEDAYARIEDDVKQKVAEGSR